ncbi:MAG: hypothetical protein L6R41_005604 [Letrouitia leprolyta]|nr:MAG: hypothetical protein L6R41_005604 [Letrouitia leprolyta]
MPLLQAAAAIASLLLLSANAAPQSPAAQTPRLPDKCGPAIQIPGVDPSDSCEAEPLVVSNVAPFGILGDTISTPSNDTSSSGPNWENCDPAVAAICTLMAANETRAGQWYFRTGAFNYPNKGDSACQIGFWLSRDDIRPPGSNSSDPQAAPMPSQEQCVRTLNAAMTAGENRGQDGSTNVPLAPVWTSASINLKVYPELQVGQWVDSTLPGAKGTGEAVNATEAARLRLEIGVNVDLTVRLVRGPKDAHARMRIC